MKRFHFFAFAVAPLRGRAILRLKADNRRLFLFSRKGFCTRCAETGADSTLLRFLFLFSVAAKWAKPLLQLPKDANGNLTIGALDDSSIGEYTNADIAVIAENPAFPAVLGVVIPLHRGPL